MSSLLNTLTAILAISTISTAHLAILSPPQLRASWNFKNDGDIDHDVLSPLYPDGRNYPCMNGHIGMTEESSVATWEAGSTQKMTIYGEAYRCPQRDTPLTFQIPGDAPQGLAIFSWSWINHTGNREFYHKCAAITIKGGGEKPSTPFSKRPNMFIANMEGLKTTCRTMEGYDYTYPNPGPDLSGTPDPKNTGLTGDWGVIASKTGSESQMQSGNTTAQDDGNQVFDLRPGKVSAYPVSNDGTCGPNVGKSCKPGSCCSKWGSCGYFDGHCKAGCQPDYGDCGAATPSGKPKSIAKPKKSGGSVRISRPLDSMRQIFLGVVPGRVRI